MKTKILSAALSLALAVCCTALVRLTANAETEAMPALTLTGTLPERALTGTVVTAPKAEAVAADKTTSLPVTLKVFRDDAPVAVASDGKYTLEKGNYTFYYEAYDPACDYYAFESFAVDVRDVWLTISLDGVNPPAAKIGNPYTPVPGKAYLLSGDEAGVPVSVEVTGAAGVTLENGSFVPELKGEYRLIYTAEKDGERATLTQTIEITGVRPTVTVKNMPETGVAGQAIVLPRPQVFNGDGTHVTVSVSVTTGGKAVIVEDMTFTPQTAGDYAVVYTATNRDGISAEAAFTVSVTGQKKGCGCGSAAVPGAAGGGAAVLLAVSLLLRRRRFGRAAKRTA